MKYLVACLALLMPALAEAQLPRGLFPWWEGGLARDMKLTPEQGRQIRDILRDSRGKLIDLRASVEKSEGEVSDFFNDESVDEAKAGAAIDKLVDQRGDLMREYSRMALKLRAVLTPQQWRELQRRRPPQAGPQGPPEGPMPGGRGRPGMAPRPAGPPIDE